MEADEFFERPDLRDPPIKIGARCDMPIFPKSSLLSQQIHDGNNNMSESETAPEIGPRFTKATIIRISAVAFFVTLGSIAVIQSMKYVSSDSNGDASQLISDTKNPTPDDGTLNKETAPSQPPSAFKEPVNSTAEKKPFTLGKPSSPGLVKSTPPPTRSFKPASLPAQTSFSTFDVRQKNFSPATKKSPDDSLDSDIPLVKAAAVAIRPDRFASNAAPLPFSNPNGNSKLSEDPTKLPANLKLEPKKTDLKKPDPFRTNTPLNQGVNISKTKTSPPASANNSATLLLEQVTDTKQSNRPSPQPPAGGFTLPASKPSLPNLTIPQSPQATPNNPASANIESFNNRTRSPKNLVAIPNGNLASPPPAKLGSGLNPKSFEADVPSAFASQPPLRQNPAITTQPLGSTQKQLGAQQGLILPKTSINPQPQTSFPPNQNPLDNERKSKQSGFISLASPSNPIAPTPATRLTRDTPGDRQLEGIQAPSLTIEKLSPIEIQLNQQASFEIVVRNIGRVAAEEVQVVDQVPAGCEFVRSTPQTQPRGKTQILNWNLGTLRPGQEKKIAFQLKPTQPGEMGSVAQVTFATQASMRTLVTKPVLEIVHQTEATHLIGDSVILDVIVINKGDGPAKNVLIQQKVPEQLEFPDGLPGASRGIEYEIGTLMPGKSQRVKLALKAANIGKIQSTMYASAEGGLRAQHELPIEVIAPKLVTQSSGPKKRFLKRSATHEFRVANQGTANATNVQILAKLPSGLRFVQANNQGRYDSASHAVYWSLAELAQNIEAKVELKTMPVDVGNQPIQFESTADLNIKSALEHDLSVEHLVDVFFEIDDIIDPIEIGGNTNYRVRVVNQGTKAATNIRLQIDFPAGLAPTSVNGSLRHTIRGQQIIFEPINSMKPNDELSFMINGRGQLVGDHRVVVSMQTDGRTSPVSKQESTRVYSDQ